MSDAELRRLRDDLATVQQAAGLGLPFGWADVREALALAPAGALLSAWAIFGPEQALAVGLLPLLLLTLISGVRRFVSRHGTETAPVPRREQHFHTASLLAVVAGLTVYFLWV